MPVYFEDIAVSFTYTTPKRSVFEADIVNFVAKDKTITATLIDSKPTRDFISLLPLTLTMNDLFHREKFAHLPNAISTEGRRAHTYEVGEIAYWFPGPDVAIYSRQDGESIPSPGIIPIRKIDAGAEALNVPGSVKVTIKLAKYVT